MGLTLFIESLRRFYDTRRIAVAAFACPHADKCAADASPRPLNRGAEAFVGSRYGDLTRVVVVSLDTGGESRSLQDRRTDIETIHSREGLNPHMRGTLETLETLFSGKVEGLEVLRYYAMTNASKCSGADGSRSMVPRPLYERCSEFTIGELAALQPQVVVTQGVRAREFLGTRELTQAEHADLGRGTAGWFIGGFSVQHWLDAILQQYVRILELPGGEAVVVHTPHPSDRGGRWHLFKKLSLGVVGAVATTLVERFQGKGRQSALEP